MSSRTFSEVALFTDDVPGVRGFYQRLLDTKPEDEWPGGAVFGTGSIKLLVHERGESPAGGPPNEDHVALGVRELDRVCDELRRGGLTFLVEPRDFPWGRSAYLRDPDGRLVELSDGY
jgi:catechol 2,3-dioxygenase-like lactoylglutathione lyase family enzyme